MLQFYLPNLTFVVLQQHEAVYRDVAVIPHWHGEDVAEPKGEALNLPAAVRPIHTYGCKPERDQKNDITHATIVHFINDYN